MGRSREGAWIEILWSVYWLSLRAGRSREGAWIEIEDIFKLGFVTIKVAPVRERGLKLKIYRTDHDKKQGRSREGAWIEISMMNINPVTQTVAPVRERGLKLQEQIRSCPIPQGRSREGAWIEIKNNCK